MTMLTRKIHIFDAVKASPSRNKIQKHMNTKESYLAPATIVVDLRLEANILSGGPNSAARTSYGEADEI